MDKQEQVSKKGKRGMRMTGAVSGHGRTGGGVKEVYTGVNEV